MLRLPAAAATQENEGRFFILSLLTGTVERKKELHTVIAKNCNLDGPVDRTTVLERKMEPTITLQGFPGGSRTKNPPANQEIPETQRRKWQSTPAFLPGKYRGQRSLAGLQSIGSQKRDMT